MPDQAQIPSGNQDHALRKHKSYRDADTQMRVQLDEQQAEVFNKVDDVIASFREKPLQRPAGQVEKLAPTAPTAAYSIDLDQPISLWKLIMLALLVCALAAGIYFYTASLGKSAKPKPLADIVQNTPVTAAPAIEPNEANPPASANPPTIEAPQKNSKPAAPKPKEPGKSKKKPSRYSENI